MEDDTRRLVLEEALIEVPFDGWTRSVLLRAGREAGVSPGALDLFFPRGVGDLLGFWSEERDEAMLADFTEANPKLHGITARITWLVRRRIEGLEPDKEAARRAAATLALPGYAPLGMRLSWRTADRIWRAVGDEATDFNHYSKRAILSGVYASTAARWFGDDGRGAPDPYQASWDFLDRRIGDVMRFEKAKARLPKPDASGLVAALGRMRYGSGR